VSYFKRLLPGIEYRFLVLPARSVFIKSTNLSQSIARTYSEKKQFVHSRAKLQSLTRHYISAHTVQGAWAMLIIYTNSYGLCHYVCSTCMLANTLLIGPEDGTKRLQLGRQICWYGLIGQDSRVGRIYE
jgi:hypothetical protein